ncbi:MAG: hypothetical protein FJW30_23380 [Acidobacteria bacterium]|nr:hypothetical protein [Acidobacteriota bacterium]
MALRILLILLVSASVAAQELAFPLTARLQSRVPSGGIAADSFYLPGSADVGCFEGTSTNRRFLCLSDSGTILEWTAENRIRQLADGFTGPLRARAADDGSLYVLDLGRGTLSLIAPNGTVTRIMASGSDRVIRPQLDPRTFDLPYFVLSRDFYQNSTQMAVDPQGNLYIAILREENTVEAGQPSTKRFFWVLRMENRGTTLALHFDGTSAMAGKSALPDLTSFSVTADRTMIFAMDGQISRLAGTNYTEFRGGTFTQLNANPAGEVASLSNGDTIIQTQSGSLFRLAFAELRTDLNPIGRLTGKIARAGNQVIGFDYNENRLVRFVPNAQTIYASEEVARMLRYIPVTGNNAFRPAFDNPVSVSVDNQGQVYVVEGEDGSVYRITTNGVLQRAATPAIPPIVTPPSEAIPSNALPAPVVAVTNDSDGRLYLVDRQCNFFVQTEPNILRRAGNLGAGCDRVSMLTDSAKRVHIAVHSTGQIVTGNGDPIAGNWTFSPAYSGQPILSMSLLPTGELLVLDGANLNFWRLHRVNPTSRAVVTLRLDDSLRTSGNVRLSSVAVDSASRILAVSCCTTGSTSQAGRQYLISMTYDGNNLLTGASRPVTFFDEPGQSPVQVFTHPRGALIRTNLNRIYYFEDPQFRATSSVGLPNRQTWTYPPDSGTQELSIPVNPGFGPTAFRTRMSCTNDFDRFVRIGPAAAVAPTQLRLALDTLNAPSRAASCRIEILAVDTARLLANTTVDLTPDAELLRRIPPLSVLDQLTPFSVDPASPTVTRTIRVFNNAPDAFAASVSGTLPEGIAITPASVQLQPKQSGEFTITLTTASLPRQQYRVPLRARCTPCSTDPVLLDLSFQISGRTTSIDLSAEAALVEASSINARNTSRVAATSLVLSGLDESDVLIRTEAGASWFTMQKAETTRTEDGRLVIGYDVQVNRANLPTRQTSSIVTFEARTSQTVARRYLTVFFFPAGASAQRLYEAGSAGATVNLSTARTATVTIPVFSRATSAAVFSTYSLGGEAGVVSVPSTQGVVGAGSNEIQLEVQRTGSATSASETKDVVILFANGEKLLYTLNVLTSGAQAAPSSKSSVREAIGSCSSARLLLSTREPGLPFTVVRNVGLRFRLELKDECNQLVNISDKAQVRFTVEPANGTNTVTSVGNGIWEIFWRPERSQQNTVAKIVAVRGVSEREIYVGTASLNGSVVDSTVPSLRSFSVRDAISYQEKSFTAPGAFITIFGENMAQADRLGLDTPGTFPTELGGVQVEFNGKPAPLLFVSPAQINLQVPFDLQLSEYRLIVKRGELVSAPSALGVGSASPAVFTADQTGRGQALVFRSGAEGAQILAGPGAAAWQGEIVTIWAAGLGPTNPLVDEGKAVSADSRFDTTGQVQVRFGEKLASQVAAFLAPGQIGIYLVTAMIPADAPLGDAVPMSIAANGVESQEVTVAIAAAAPATPAERLDP